MTFADALMNEPTPESKPKGRRRQRPQEDRSELPLSTSLPLDNPAAKRGFQLAMLGLIPILGLIFGALAIVYCCRGRRYARSEPGVQGWEHATVGLFLGIAEVGCNAAGLFFVAKGLEWL